MKTTRAILRICSLAALLLVGACAHDGTIITTEPVSVAHLRAADQAVLADAIDTAFTKLDVTTFASELGGRSLTAYMVVTSPVKLPPAIMDYVRERAALVAGVLGIQVREVVLQRERVLATGPIEYEYLSYPDTQARVLVLVSYAGVDEEVLEPRQETHGTKDADKILHGRFRASFGITPRTEGFTAITQTVEGESAYSLSYGKYVVDDIE